jgi:hypothetical protein
MDGYQAANEIGPLAGGRQLENEGFESDSVIALRTTRSCLLDSTGSKSYTCRLHRSAFASAQRRSFKTLRRHPDSSENWPHIW